MTYAYVDRTERVGDLIVQVVADEHGVNPYREYEQTSEVFGEYRNLDIDAPPPEHIRVLERVGLRGLVRYMRLFGDPRDGTKLLAIRQLAVLDHSGVTVWTEEIGSRRAHMVDPGGWDTSRIGYVMISQGRWDKVNGGDPNEEVDGEAKIGLGRIPVKMTRAYAVLEAEVEEWDDALCGNVWGYVITKPCSTPDEHDDDAEIADCPHSEHLDSCWGFIGDPQYAFDEGKAVAESHAQA